RLPEYAARMKPVIPDYEWITYGERVRSRLFLIMNGSHTGSGSVMKLLVGARLLCWVLELLEEVAEALRISANSSCLAVLWTGLLYSAQPRLILQSLSIYEDDSGVTFLRQDYW
ncbi:hypothetical protein ABEH87_00005, partial [Erwinia sp. Eh17-17]|uniref:hypothetical protein n=1 Tax=Erwinia sp. Eh17-17 TaxID=3080330 RepID=UPI003208C865